MIASPAVTHLSYVLQDDSLQSIPGSRLCGAGHHHESLISQAAGLGITQAAEQVLGRIASIVYVDALHSARWSGIRRPCAGLGSLWKYSCAATDCPGDYFDEADRQWVDRRATPQPTATSRDAASHRRISARAQEGLRRATGWASPFDAAVAAARDADWTVHEVACGHDVAIDKPDELATILQTCA